MEAFGIMSMSFGSFGIIAFIFAINLNSKVGQLEKRIKDLENK